MDPSIQDAEINFFELYLAIKKRLKLILGLFVITVFLSITILVMVNMLSRPVFRSSFKLQIPIISTNVSAAQVEASINHLNYSLIQGHIKQLADDLGLTEKDVASLVTITTKWAKKNNSKDIVEVTIDVDNPDVVSELTKGIVNNLNQEKIFRENILRNKEKIEKQLYEMRSDLKDLEKLRYNVVKDLNQGNTEMIRFNLWQLQNSIRDLKKQIAENEENFTSLNNAGFMVLHGPSPPEKRNEIRMIRTIILLSVTALIVGIFLAVFLEWVEKNKKHHQ